MAQMQDDYSSSPRSILQGEKKVQFVDHVTASWFPFQSVLTSLLVER
jgi:hypothetical protein